MSALDPWVSERPALFRAEQELTQRFTNGRIARDGQVIVFEEEVQVSGITFSYQIRYAADHPYSAPSVYLRWPELPKTAEVHRFRDGSLCLHGPEEWHPSHTAALWLRNRVVAWIAALLSFSRTGVWDMKAGR